MTLGNITVNIKCIDSFSKPVFEQMKILFWNFLDKDIRLSVLKAFEE